MSWVASFGQYKRFQDTKDFSSDYCSNHCLWDAETDDNIKDPAVMEAGLYADVDDNENFRLKTGYVFCEYSIAETEEEFLKESTQGGGNVCSTDYAIFLESDQDVFVVLGDDGIIINLKECKVIKVIKV